MSSVDLRINRAQFLTAWAVSYERAYVLFHIFPHLVKTKKSSEGTVVKAATLVEEDEDDDDKTSLIIVNGRAISVRFGHNRDSASANSLSDLLTK